MSRQPAYQTVAAALREQILQGDYQPGQRLPGELELGEHFGVSRNTVRSALDRLTAANLVHRRRGSGTFVAEGNGISHSLGSLRSLTQIITDLGLEPGIGMLELAVDPDPPPEVSGFFAPGVLWRLRRVRTASGRPFALMDSWLPDHIGRSLDPRRLAQVQSLYRVLSEDCQVTVAEATETIHADAAGEDEADALTVPLGTPVLVMRRWTYDPNGRPIEYAESAARGDLYRYVIKLRA